MMLHGHPEFDIHLESLQACHVVSELQFRMWLIPIMRTNLQSLLSSQTSTGLPNCFPSNFKNFQLEGEDLELSRFHYSVFVRCVLSLKFGSFLRHNLSV